MHECPGFKHKLAGNRTPVCNNILFYLVAALKIIGKFMAYAHCRAFELSYRFGR